MAVKLSQSLKQSQSLMMTPQLQQAIKLLTLTHLEMTSVIAEEMVENPMLEEFGNGNESEVPDAKSEQDYKVEKLESQGAEAKSENFEEAPVISKDEDFDWQKYVETYNNSSSTPSMVGPVSNDDTPNYENIISKGESLADHLEWQLRMEDLSEQELMLGVEIIHNINDDGYLCLSYEEVIANTELDRDHAFDVLEMVQRFDPVGCGAANLTDCLLAQARIAEERSPLLEKIICNHLPDLHKKDYAKICKETGVSQEVIIETSKLLHQFHPKPGRLVSGQETHYIAPDIYVVNVGGEFVVQVNDEGIPRLRISKLYQQLLSTTKGEKNEASEYVLEKLKSAKWLLKSIQTRQQTIYKVSKAIVRQQQEFFKKGPKFLKPMVLKDVANEIGMHESTVSRVTTSKYMHTPIGLFELKYFFNTGIGGKNGGVDISSEVLKLKIKELVANESPKKPLSDQKIADLLSRVDVKVARRTVAKYREILDIDSSSKRKVKC